MGYWGPNRSVFSMSQIEEDTFLITLGTVLIDLIFTTVSCIAVHRYYAKTHGIKPLYHACILVRDNLGYVVINMSLGLMWVQGLLGKHWTGVWFMKEWLMEQQFFNANPLFKFLIVSYLMSSHDSSLQLY